MQVLHRRCIVCKVIVGCYNSERFTQQKDCRLCVDDMCYLPNSPDSHGYCKYHFTIQLLRIRRKRRQLKKEKENEAILSKRGEPAEKG